MKGLDMKTAIFAALLSLGMASGAAAADIPKGCKKSKARPANPYGSILVQQTQPAQSPSDQNEQAEPDVPVDQNSSADPAEQKEQDGNSDG